MPRPVSYPAPVRVEYVAGGGPLGVAILPGPQISSGLAWGALTAGIGSFLVAMVVWCFGLSGAEDGWGAVVSGAFCALSVLLGLAAAGLGIAGLRQIKRHKPMSGKGLAIAGIVSGGVGVLAALAGVVTAILLG